MEGSTTATRTFGTTLDIDLREPLTAEQKRLVADAFRDSQVVIFPNANLSEEQLHRFVLSLGSPDDGRGQLAAGLDGYTGIRVVENAVAGLYGPKSNSELHWHSDRFFDPVAAGVLNSIIVPDEGGDTSFADMYAALEEMPEDLRTAIDGRSIKQDCLVLPDGSHGIRPGSERVEDVTTSFGIALPIIQLHPRSGRPFLYLGNRENAWVVGLPVAQSEALLDRLYAHVDQPRFHYRHTWKPHELVLYDNRCCMHRREAFAPDAQRKLYAAVVVESDLL